MDSFRCLIRNADFNIEQAAQFLGRSTRTVERWCRQNNPPKWAFEALAFRAGCLQGWEGFKLRDDHIINPHGEQVHRNTIANIEYFAYLQRSMGYLDKRPQRPYHVEDNVLYPIFNRA
jgi:hypothetical protein